MKQEVLRERPFEYLRRLDGMEPFPKEVVRNWYVARAFVLEKLKDISFAPDADTHLHAVVDGDSPLMLSVVRAISLSAHYLNYVESYPDEHRPCRNRTVISLVTAKDAAAITEELEKEENLCNLPKYCRLSVFGEVKNEDSFIDIELDIARSRPEDTDCVVITEDEVRSFAASHDPDVLFSVDTRKAVFANRAYNLGAAVDNLPHEDVHGAGRYNQALYTFQYKVLQNRESVPFIGPDWEKDQYVVRNGLSNIHCSDCFESRELAVRRQCPGYESLNDTKKMALWEKNNNALAHSEHNRWIVERLIMGYRPFSTLEKTAYQGLFGKDRAAYASRLKTDRSSPAHLDLCSYRDLRRIDPDNMKYDSFLVLAIPLILEAIR